MIPNIEKLEHMITLSIILPCYNEEEALQKTYQTILKEVNKPEKLADFGLSRMQINFVLIDDGSKDRTWEIIKDIKQNQESSARKKRTVGSIDIQVFGISLSRNFGKESALLAGLELCPKSDYYLTLDADLQDDPKIIWEMMSRAVPNSAPKASVKKTSRKKSAAGDTEKDAKDDTQSKTRESKSISNTGDLVDTVLADIVYGQRSSRDDGPIYTFCTRIFYAIISGGKSQIPPNVADFYLISEKVRRAFLANSEKVRFTRGLVFSSGFRQVPVLYHRPNRHAGTTKWNYLKLTKFAVDAITSFGSFPLHLISFVGIVGSILSFLGSIVYVFVSIVFGFVKLEGWISLILFISFFSSIQILFMGIVSEYIARIHTEVKNRPSYFVGETTFEE